MWHVSSRSGVATLRTAIHLLLTYLPYRPADGSTSCRDVCWLLGAGSSDGGSETSSDSQSGGACVLIAESSSDDDESLSAGDCRGLNAAVQRRHRHVRVSCNTSIASVRTGLTAAYIGLQCKVNGKGSPYSITGSWQSACRWRES